MKRRIVVAIAIAALAVLAVRESLAAGPGIFRSRSGARGQTGTRVYRSYSVSPGNAAAPDGSLGVDSGNTVSRPTPSQPRRSSSSKPSYMRADSKASGRFGQ